MIRWYSLSFSLCHSPALLCPCLKLWGLWGCSSLTTAPSSLWWHCLGQPSPLVMLWSWSPVRNIHYQPLHSFRSVLSIELFRRVMLLLLRPVWENIHVKENSDLQSRTFQTKLPIWEHMRKTSKKHCADYTPLSPCWCFLCGLIHTQNKFHNNP